MKLFVFPDPIDATATFTHDSGPVIAGVPDVHPSGRPCQSFDVTNLPDSNGAQWEFSAEGKVPVRQRGILLTTSSPLAPLASFLVDDVRLANGAGRFL